MASVREVQTRYVEARADQIAKDPDGATRWPKGRNDLGPTCAIENSQIFFRRKSAHVCSLPIFPAMPDMRPHGLTTKFARRRQF
ncbi:hypothetical protein GRAN_0681 [Granulicella sibirica]|uniref:Uncharacterized protein n=1 Tax=Granulicella sibirica TaxID=2479048 RepID=A0A4Q0T702_9BACT|nr:hypothetical protein GRAN_0681 [Granulicella sibirica]